MKIEHCISSGSKLCLAFPSRKRGRAGNSEKGAIPPNITIEIEVFFNYTGFDRNAVNINDALCVNLVNCLFSTVKRKEKKGKWPIRMPPQDADAAPTPTANLNSKTETQCTHCTGTPASTTAQSLSISYWRFCLSKFI